MPSRYSPQTDTHDSNGCLCFDIAWPEYSFPRRVQTKARFYLHFLAWAWPCAGFCAFGRPFLCPHEDLQSGLARHSLRLVLVHAVPAKLFTRLPLTKPSLCDSLCNSMRPEGINVTTGAGRQTVRRRAGCFGPKCVPIDSALKPAGIPVKVNHAQSPIPANSAKFKQFQVNSTKLTARCPPRQVLLRFRQIGGRMVRARLDEREKQANSWKPMKKFQWILAPR